MPPTSLQLAQSLAQQGQLTRAIDELRPILAADPNHTDAAFLLGWCLLRRRDLAEAEPLLRQGLDATPLDVARLLSLADCLRLQNRPDDAAATLRSAASRGLAEPNVLSYLANLDAEGGRAGEAHILYQHILAANPTHAPTLNALGVLLCAAGQTDEGLSMLQRAVLAAPRDLQQRARFCFHLNYSPTPTPREVFSAHRELGQLARQVMPVHPAPHAPTPTAGRRLRVGYVSPEFRRHSIAYFIEPLLIGHDRARFEVFAYHTSPGGDDVTERLSKAADHWRVAAEPDVRVLAEAVRRDRIDVLIDLAGLTGPCRVLAFASRHAPVQATYLGYCNTSGVPNVDFRIVDPHTDPPQTSGNDPAADSLATEQLIRLPRCFLCYHPPDNAPQPHAPPADAPITFASFNNAPKVSPRAVELWSRVLLALPGSRLLLKGKRFADPWFQSQFADHFAARGVARSQLDFVGRIDDPAGHLAAYSRVHVALDTFPYHGTTTTCEALWMGVPVITRAGNTHAARVGASLLHAAGLPDLIANTDDQFVERATTLARDTARLTTLRHTLRDRLRSSPLTDREAFVHAFEDALLSMWNTACEAHARKAASGPYYT